MRMNFKIVQSMSQIRIDVRLFIVIFFFEQPLSYLNSAGSVSNFLSQYSEKVVTWYTLTDQFNTSALICLPRTIVFKTILIFLKTVDVHPMKTFFVCMVIAECAPLIVCGNDSTM